MKGLSKTFQELTSIFADITLLSAVFFTFAVLQTDEVMYLRFIPWLLFVYAIYAGNRLLMARGTVLNFIFAYNIAAFLCLCALGCMFFASISGVMAHLFAIAFWGVTCYRSFFAAKDGITANQILFSTEAHIVCVALLLWAVGMGTEVIMQCKVSLIMSLGLNLISLMLSRVVTDSATKVGGDHRQGALAVGVIVSVIAVFAVGVLSVLFSGIRKGLFIFYSVAENVIRFVLNVLSAAVMWFFSLFPQSVEMGEFAPEQAAASPEMSMEIAEDNSGIILYIILALGVIALIAGLVLLFRYFGKQRSERIVLKVNMEGAVLNKVSFLDMLKSLFGSVVKRIKLNIISFRKRNTIEGVLLYAERKAKKRGKGRGKGESGAVFFKRLLAENSFEKCEADLVMAAANRLDMTFYGKGNEHFSKKDTKKLKKILKNGLYKK